MTKENTISEVSKHEDQNSQEGSSARRIFFDRERYELERKERRKRLYLILVFVLAFSVLVFASINNPAIYEIDKSVQEVINRAFNAVILLVVPFLLGSLGAIARVLMAGIKSEHQGALIVGSGLMAMFSWVGIKSGVLLAIVAPHLEKQGISSAISVQTEGNFYTMALVAILVGMFSTNLYIFINQRVEQVVAQKKHDKLVKQET